MLARTHTFHGGEKLVRIMTKKTKQGCICLNARCGVLFSVIFSLTGYEVTLSTVAAFLTIVGYSLNDTIVILDPASGAEAKGIVTASNTTTGVITVAPFDNVALGATFYAGAGGATLKVFVYGSSYAKGTNLNGVAAGAGCAHFQGGWSPP